MKTLFRLGLLIAFLSLSIGFSNAQSAQDQSAEAFLMQYINALNTQDYATAYNMIDNRSDSYNDFAAGYEHTVRIVPYFGFASGAAGSAYVTSILLGYQDDGSIETYYGYFQLHSGQVYTPVRNNGGWVLGSTRFQLIGEADAPHNDVIADLLSREWQENLPTQSAPTGIMPTISEMNREMPNALFRYYDLINTGDYSTAYSYWMGTAQGLQRGHALPYTNFVAGYNDTKYVTVYVGLDQLAANSLITYLPTVLVSEHDDGSFDTYSGCYALGRFSNNVVGIANGKFSLLLEDAPNSEGIFTALANLNCANLNIGL